jgi:hypothetical protein
LRARLCLSLILQRPLRRLHRHLLAGTRRRAPPSPARPRAPACSPERAATLAPPPPPPARRAPACSPRARLLAPPSTARRAPASAPRARQLAARSPARPALARSTAACSSAGVPVCSAASPPPGAQPPHISSSPFHPARYSPGPAPPVTIVASGNYFRVFILYFLY